MKIISTNIAKPMTIIWNGNKETTGIYKKPVNKGITLGKHVVAGDEVSDRIHHGGEFKACYLFSAEHYPYWKSLYPNLDWDWGMFGENLTVSGLQEKELHVGDVYKIGSVLVQVTQPREPCYKFGVKFGTHKVLKQFINHGYSGTYIKVLEQGIVKSGDQITLVEKAQHSVSIYDFFNLLYNKEKNQKHLEILIKHYAIPKRQQNKLASFLK